MGKNIHVAACRVKVLHPNGRKTIEKFYNLNVAYTYSLDLCAGSLCSRSTFYRRLLASPGDWIEVGNSDFSRVFALLEV